MANGHTTIQGPLGDLEVTLRDWNDSHEIASITVYTDEGATRFDDIDDAIEAIGLACQWDEVMVVEQASGAWDHKRDLARR